MKVTVGKGIAAGSVKAPPSKSMAHRLLIAAAFADGTGTVRGISPCQDVSATLDCLAALGVDYRGEGDSVTLSGISPCNAAPKASLACRESGSTLRFLIPIALLSGNETLLCGAPSLLARPMGVYATLCREKGLLFEQTAEGIRVKGPLTAGEYLLPGDVSSQFITGLLFALPFVDGDSILRVTPPFESRSYVDLTLSALSRFGVTVEPIDGCTFRIPGNQRPHACDVTVEGDYSNAAFLEAFNLLGGSVEITGLSDTSLQGDRVYRTLFAQLKEGTPTLSLADCPDLGPILFSMAAALNGATFTDAGRLRIKESDRVECMRAELEKFGARLRVDGDRVTVEKATLHAPTEPLCSHNDHRIAMSMAVLATRYTGEILGAEAVAKSFPDFFAYLDALGVRTERTE